MTSSPDNQALNDQGNSAIRDNDSARQNVANAEKTAVGNTVAGKVAISASSAVNPVVGGAIRILGKIKTRKGVTTVIVIGVLFILLALGGLFTTALAPIAFFSNVSDDLNDQVAALDNRGQKMMRLKVSAAERDASLKGCTKISIRCKFKSLSKNQVESFRKQGIEVKYSKTILGRIFPEKYTFKGQSYNPQKFADLIKTNPEAKIAFKTAVNMRYLSVADGIFQRVMDRFGVSKKKPQLTGDAEEQAKQLADPESLKVPRDPKFVPVEGEKDTFRIEGDPTNPPRTYSGAQRDAILAGIKTAPPSQLNKEMLKSASIIGWYDMACSFKNLVGQASVGAKLARSIKFAQYVMPIASLVYAIKAGDGTARDAEAAGKFFMDPDNRKLISDLKGTLEASGAVDNTGGINNVAMKDNPYYGKNVMDSSLYKMSAYGAPAKTNDSTLQYSVGMSASSVMAGVATSADIINRIVNLGSSGNNVCKLVQSWYVRAGGFVVGVAAMFFSGGGSLLFNIGLMSAIMGGFYVVNSVLHSILSDEVVPEGIEKLPEQKAAITWTGMSSVLGESSRTRALIPAKASDLVKYQESTVSSLSDYKTIAQVQTSPFDITSPDSMAGKFATSLYQYKPLSNNLSSYAGSLLSVVSSSAQSVFKNTSVYAASTIDQSRFTHCDDGAYADLGIDADIQCNVRYMMPEEDLAKDPDVVAKYMEDNNFVEKETTTGLPPGYTPPSPKESANVAVSLLNGFTSSFYDNRAALYTAPSGDYAQYLDYCVYRAFPWGKTYEESTALGSADDDWKTGKNCLLRDGSDLGTKVSNFRIYTLDRSANDASEPPSEVYSDTQATANPGGSEAPTLPDGTWIWPANGPIMQPWGVWNARRNGAHKGIDIGVQAGTPVKVAHSGTVVNSGATYNDPACGYMVTMKVDGSNPAIYENYQHLSPTGPLPSGHYNAGQLLGKVAAMSEINKTYTCSTGAHLHFQIQKVDSFVVGYSSALSLTLDPLTFLPAKP